MNLVIQLIPKGNAASIISCPNILSQIGLAIRAIQDPIKDTNTPKPRETLIPKRSITKIAGMHMMK